MKKNTIYRCYFLVLSILFMAQNVSATLIAENDMDAMSDMSFFMHQQAHVDAHPVNRVRRGVKKVGDLFSSLGRGIQKCASTVTCCFRGKRQKFDEEDERRVEAHPFGDPSEDDESLFFCDDESLYDVTTWQKPATHNGSRANPSEYPPVELQAPGADPDERDATGLIATGAHL